MQKKNVLAALALATALSATAQINAPDAEGYLTRGRAMLDDANYTGCIDQLRQALTLPGLTDEQRSRAELLSAMASMHTAGGNAETRLKAWLDRYPASPLRNTARLCLADLAMARSAAEALPLYEAIDARTLSERERDDRSYHIAYCRMLLADFDKAQAGFNALTGTKRYGNAARFYLGYIAYCRGDYATAKRELTAVNTAAEPGNMADYYLGQIYYADGEWDKALQNMRRMLARCGAPKAFEAEAERIAGEALYHLGDNAEAVEHLKRYTALCSDPRPSAMYILGMAEYAGADYEAAVASLNHVTDGDNAMAQSAYLFIGQALLRLGDTDAALLAFDKALQTDHDPAVREAAYYNYAVARFGGGNIPFGSSAATFEEFLRRYPDSRYAPAVQEYLVNGYMTDNNYESALESINRFARPGEAVLRAKQRVLYTLGARDNATGNTARAVERLREALTLSRHDAETARETRLVLGEALYREGRYDEARKELSEYLRTTPRGAANLPLANYDMGYTLFALRDYKAAAESFGRFIGRPGGLGRPIVADAYNRVADTHYYAGDFDEAAAVYDKAYATDPSAGDYAMFQKAVMRGYMRDYPAKIKGLEAMLGEFPSSALVPDALLEMTQAYIESGDNESAIATYRRLISGYSATPQGRQGYIQLAMTLINDGRKAEAIDTYKDIIRLYPTSDEARQAADRLKVISAEDGSIDDYMAFINSVDNAPKIDAGEADRLAFEAAEKAFLTRGDTSRLEAYAARAEGAHTAAALGYLMNAATEAGDRDKALRHATALVERYPDNSATEEALAIKAEAEFDAGRGTDALATWQKLEQRASTPRQANRARLGMMRVARDLGDNELMDNAARALLASSTAGSEVKNEATFTRGLALSGRGDRDGAESLWAGIADQTDDLYGAKSAYYHAQSLMDRGRTDSAARAVEKFINSGTPHDYWLARGFILLSDIYSAQGKKFEAKEYLKALRENYPGKETDISIMIDERLSSL